MVGIIGSLIFVGLEMRQSQRIALAGQQALRTQFWLDGVDALSEPQKKTLLGHPDAPKVIETAFKHYLKWQLAIYPSLRTMHG